jgi:hypothetical protein
MPNGNQRGSTADRRRRKLWLLSPEGGWGGDGIDVPCWECGVLCEYEDLVADRIIPWCRGGTYARGNIAPHCHQCSHQQGQRITTSICNARRSAEWIASHVYLAVPV